MARTHLTLAALATAAVPGLDVQSARSHSGSGHGEFDSAVVTDRDGREVIVRMPRTQAAETEQAADLVALRALTTGVRSRLPFDVPEYLGQAPINGTRALAYGFLPGHPVGLDHLTSDAGLAGSVGRAIAAVHSLPTSFISDAGLPLQTAPDARAAAITLVGRAADTGHLPAALLRRWEEATDDDSLWQFAPVVINGSLSAASLLVSDDAISAIIGWSGLRVGDSARDLHWLLASRGEAAETAIAAYTAGRGSASDRLITQRAMLYAELELARWLLHGVETHDEAVIADAVAMLDGLVDSVHADVMNPISPLTGPVMAVSDVEAMLQDTPRTDLRRGGGAEMHTDSYDQSSFELESYGEPEKPAWHTLSKTGEPFASHDELETGPIELFSMPQDDAEPSDAASTGDPGDDPDATAAFDAEFEARSGSRRVSDETDDHSSSRSSSS